MGLRITIDVFSGRSNPTVEVVGQAARELARRLRPVRRLDEHEAGLPWSPTLGYRGIMFEQTGRTRIPNLPRWFRLVGADVFGPGLAHRVQDEGIEDFVCGSTGPFRPFQPETDFLERLRGEVRRFAELRPKFPADVVALPWLTGCRCAPLYEPAWWNVPGRQESNNCYNFATNVRTDTFARPAGAESTTFECPSVRAAAIADQLVDSPDADNRCPSEGHLVALVIAPGPGFSDFHWYRKGRDGAWSHKPGPSAVTNVDNSGAAIGDPRSADRGPYTDFCTFMVVMHGHVRIG
jgi:hypothetical protein